MRLTVLGSGTALPTKQRLPSSFLIETEKTKLLLDCGFGSLARMVALGFDPRDIDGVFVSHFHPDHFGDAFNLVCARFIGNIYQNTPQHILKFYGPATLRDRFLKWREIMWSEANENHPLEFNEGVGEHDLGDLHLKIFPITHVTHFQSVGVRVSRGEKSLVYTGDVGGSQDFKELATYAAGANLLVIESGYEISTPNHLSLHDIEHLVNLTQMRRTLLAHIRAKVGEEKRLKEFVQAHSTFTLAEDGMTIDL